MTLRESLDVSVKPAALLLLLFQFHRSEQERGSKNERRDNKTTPHGKPLDAGGNVEITRWELYPGCWFSPAILRLVLSVLPPRPATICATR